MNKLNEILFFFTEFYLDSTKIECKFKTKKITRISSSMLIVTSSLIENVHCVIMPSLLLSHEQPFMWFHSSVCSQKNYRDCKTKHHLSVLLGAQDELDRGNETPLLGIFSI